MYGEWFFCSESIVACRSIVHYYLLTKCCTYLLILESHEIVTLTRPARGFSEIGSALTNQVGAYGAIQTRPSTDTCTDTYAVLRTEYMYHLVCNVTVHTNTCLGH